MAKTNSQILADIRIEYPQLSGVSDARITAFIAEARDVWVPTCRLSGSRLDLAVKYKGLSLLKSSLSVTPTGGGGGVKKMKDGDVEIEYDSASASLSGQDFEGLYQRLVRAAKRVSPMVLDGT